MAKSYAGVHFVNASAKRFLKKNNHPEMDLLNNEYLLFFFCAGKNKLRYLMIGGYAVNYYGYNRNTRDLDIWLAPTNENKNAFMQTLICMGYADSEVAPIGKEDFTLPYIANVGGPDAPMDFLTVVHHSVSFDAAENEKMIFNVADGPEVNLVSYNFLIDLKLRARRPKDLFDIEQLNRLRNNL